MTAPWSVTFDRTSLSLSPLVIDNDPFTGNFHLPEDGTERPGRKIRRTYAPTSAYVAGSYLLAAVEDSGTLPLSIYVHGTDATDLEAAIDELEAAVTQFAYTVTVTVDGVARSFNADPELPSWGVLDSGMVGAHLARASIVIPINPA